MTPTVQILASDPEEEWEPSVPGAPCEGHGRLHTGPPPCRVPPCAAPVPHRFLSPGLAAASRPLVLPFLPQPAAPRPSTPVHFLCPLPASLTGKKTLM